MQLKQFYYIATKVSSRKKVLILLVIYLTAQEIYISIEIIANDHNTHTH